MIVFNCPAALKGFSWKLNSREFLLTGDGVMANPLRNLKSTLARRRLTELCIRPLISVFEVSARSLKDNRRLLVSKESLKRCRARVAVPLRLRERRSMTPKRVGTRVDGWYRVLRLGEGLEDFWVVDAEMDVGPGKGRKTFSMTSNATLTRPARTRAVTR